MDGDRNASATRESRFPFDPAQGAELWLAQQQQFIEQLDTFLQDWMNRRRTDLEGARQSLREMQACRDASDWLRITQKLSSECMQRLSEDFSSWSGLVLEIPRRVGRSLEASARSDEIVRASPATAGTKPRTRGRPRKARGG